MAKSGSRRVSRDAKTGKFLTHSPSKAIKSSAGLLAKSYLAAMPLGIDYTQVKSGIPASTIKDFLDKGRLRRSDVQMVIPRRTFERRLSENQTLKIGEADAIARLIRVRDHARRAFEDDDVAEEWLSLPNPELGGEIPIKMARTDIGARDVEAVLTRFEHGVYG